MKSTRVTVATTATQIRKLKAGGACMIRVPTGGADVYLGGADVTTSNGFLVAATESVPWSATAAETIFGIVAASTQVVHVLTAGEYD